MKLVTETQTLVSLGACLIYKSFIAILHFLTPKHSTTTSFQWHFYKHPWLLAACNCSQDFITQLYYSSTMWVERDGDFNPSNKHSKPPLGKIPNTLRNHVLRMSFGTVFLFL